MQVPLSLFAVDPGEGGLAKARDEIVAPRVVAVPPAAFDALGSGEELEARLVETARRLDEPGGPRTRLAELARVPVAGLDAPPGILRAVVRRGGEAVNRTASEAQLQTLEELRPVPGGVGGMAQATRAARGEGDEMRRLEADLFDRLAKLHRRQPLAQKLAEALGRARRRSKSDFDRLGIAVRVNQGEGESADAGVPRGE